MSAGLEQYDWMMSAKERPWHGIGTVVQEAPTSADAIKIAKLDWTVRQEPIYSQSGIEIPNKFVNIREDVNYPLGLVGGRYTIVQNIEAFDFVDSIIGNDKIECRYETAGSLFNGRKIFLLVRLPNINLVGDDVENYLFFTNSHDGASPLTCGISNVRVVCNNTLQLALRQAKRVWKMNHTLGIEGKKHEAEVSLGFALEYQDVLEKTVEKLAMKKINEEKFFKRLFEVNPTNITEKAREESIERMHIIYTQKDDLQNFKGTAWGLYNAVADFCSNVKPMKMTETASDKKLNGFFDGYAWLNNTQKILMVA